MQATVTKDTVAAQADYNFLADWSLSDVRVIKPLSFWIYKTSEGVSNQSKIGVRRYDNWNLQSRNTFNNSIDATPGSIINLPNGDLRFDPTPDVAYSITFDYVKKIQQFALDADVSNIPTDYDDAILGLAMKYWGMSQDARDILSEGSSIYAETMQRLTNEQLPKITLDTTFAV